MSHSLTRFGLASVVLLVLIQPARSEDYLIRLVMTGYEHWDGMEEPPKDRVLRTVETIVRIGQPFYARSSNEAEEHMLAVHGQIDAITDEWIDGEVNGEYREYIGFDRQTKDGATEKIYDITVAGFSGRSRLVLGEARGLGLSTGSREGNGNCARTSFLRSGRRRGEAATQLLLTAAGRDRPTPSRRPRFGYGSQW